MKHTSGTHWFGVLFLFAASILLLFVTITAPVIHDLSLLYIEHNNNSDPKLHDSKTYFGTFGYCTTGTVPVVGGWPGGTYCSHHNIGYPLAETVQSLDNEDISMVKGGSADSLIYVEVIHPIACGIAFISFLMSTGAGVIGSLGGAAAALVAWILTIIALACDFTAFGIVRHHINDDQTRAVAYFGSAIWMLCAAFILLTIGQFVVLFTCFSAKRKGKGEGAGSGSADGGRSEKKVGVFGR